MIRLRRPRHPAHAVRRGAAVLLSLGALVLAVRPPAGTAVAGAPPEGIPVVVAAGDLAAGTVLDEGVLRRARWPTETVPAGAGHSPDELAGRVLAGPVRRGEAITDVRLVGPGFTSLLTPGQVAAPLRLPDLAVAGLLAAGDRVDVLATVPEAPAAEVVATRALVLTPSAGGDGSDEPFAETDGLLLLAVDETTAATLAAASATATLSVTLVPG